ETLLLNLTWAANEMLSATVYGVVQSVDYEQRGEQSTIRAGRKVIIGEWQIDTEDEANMIGLALNWEAIKDKLNLTLDLSYLDADSDVSTVWLTSTNPPNEFPAHSNKVTRLDLTADYRLNERTSIIGRWIHENDDSVDWGWNDNIDDISAVAFGYAAPDYSANVFALSVRHRF
ncbi:MAG: MtrB/PioB family outer membrane beta-barrel protein, partial [Gammaproteobacteria bacterium]|nr:MtrB/PioB family outer membrane beta-barrel protein [Gammaproteobacteria bacterium]